MSTDRSGVLGEQLRPSRDDPIASLVDDRLERSDFARTLAAQVYAGTETGLVMALTGPWGSGKSSLLNLIEDALPDDVVVIRFNPWLFTGTEELVARFFEELGAQLIDKGVDLAAIGGKLRRLGKFFAPMRFVPGVGTAFDVATTAAQELGATLEGAKASLEGQRAEIKHALSESGRRFVVTVDDIDRLEDVEVRQIMKLVRLVGDFPRVVYVLAYDDRRVSDVLSSGEENDGDRFIEKIVQISHPVPEMGRDQIDALLKAEIEAVLKRVDARSETVPDLAVVAPLFTTVRDVRRYGNALPFSLALIGDELDLRDIVAFEALRLLAPESYRQLPLIISLLDAVVEDEEGKARVVVAKRYEQLLAAGDERRHRVLRRFIGEVFPPVGAVLAGSTVNDDDVAAAREKLLVYREKILPSSWVRMEQVREIASMLGDRAVVGTTLAALTREQFEHVLVRLPRALGKRMSPEEAASGALELVLRADSEPRTTRGYITMAGPLRVAMDALTGCLADQEESCEMTERLVGGTDDLFLRFFLLNRMMRTGASARPPEECTKRITAGLVDEILALERDELRAQRALAYLLQFVVREDPERVTDVADRLSDEETLVQYLATLGVLASPSAKLLELINLRGRYDDLHKQLASSRKRRAKRALNALERISD